MKEVMKTIIIGLLIVISVPIYGIYIWMQTILDGEVLFIKWLLNNKGEAV